jgi:hypothetical protein
MDTDMRNLFVLVNWEKMILLQPLRYAYAPIAKGALFDNAKLEPYFLALVQLVASYHFFIYDPLNVQHMEILLLMRRLLKYGHSSF